MSLLDKLDKFDTQEQKKPKKSQKKLSPERLIEPSKKLRIASTEIDILQESLERVPSKLEKIRITLDTLKITQSDLWHIIDYFCKNLLPQCRESKKDLIPIFLDFVNKKLKN